ncbi:hypothetical protein SAMN05421594_2609 [Chryseobacterium oleae]|uniref:Uncharacterized protein n=1 Tax=Chryseobacterium oleae TaxID=491207 RepID=A0A1I4YQL2_CHROL|nr:hypothetical protein SAMN05421594_2609 [Chryseobacterium oleae]
MHCMKNFILPMFIVVSPLLHNVRAQVGINTSIRASSLDISVCIKNIAKGTQTTTDINTFSLNTSTLSNEVYHSSHSHSFLYPSGYTILKTHTMLRLKNRKI